MHTQPNSGASAHDAPVTAPTHESSLEEYYAAALEHLENVTPRPAEDWPLRRADVEPYFNYGDTPAEAAEFWAADALHQLEIEQGDPFPAA